MKYAHRQHRPRHASIYESPENPGQPIEPQFLARDPVAGPVAPPAPPRATVQPSAGPLPTIDAAAIRADERDRMKAVIGSDHFVGREAIAADMLDSDLTAERIVAMLAKAPKARADNAMLARLAATPNPAIGPGIENTGSGSASPDAIWDRARAANLAETTPKGH